MFQFEIMLIQLATSKHCPYSGETLNNLTLEEILSIKTRVDFLEATDLATKLDIKQEENNKRPSR